MGWEMFLGRLGLGHALVFPCFGVGLAHGHWLVQ